MAFTKTVRLKKSLPGGLTLEDGIWVADSGTATGTIVADTAITDVGDINEIYVHRVDNDIAANATTNVRDNVNKDEVDLTFTANDTGTYTLIGKAV